MTPPALCLPRRGLEQEATEGTETRGARSLCSLRCLLLTLSLCGLAVWKSPSAWGQPQPLAALQQAVIETIERAERSVVALAVLESPPESPLPLDADPFEFIIRQPGRVPSRFGGGVILHADEQQNALFVLTCQHLVETPRAPGQPLRTRRIAIRLASRHTLRATVHAADPRSDLAVLKVSLEGSGLSAADVTPATLGVAEGLRKGSFVITLGNPYALARDGSSSASLGIVSNLARAPLRSRDVTTLDRPLSMLGMLLHVETRPVPGLSGGGVFDLEARLAGLTTALAPIDGDAAPAGLAIPVTGQMQRIVAALLAGYEVEYGFLGVTPDTATRAELGAAQPPLRQAGAARVNRIAKDSPGERGGLRPEDIVLAVNGISVFNGDELMREVGLLGPEAVAELEIYRPRSREQRTLSVTLGKWPVYDDTGIIATAERFPAWRGIRVDYPTGRRRYLPTAYLAEYDRAVVITDVRPDSPAARAGLKPGQFIARVGTWPVETPREFHEAVDRLTGTAMVTLQDGTDIEIGELSP